MKKCFLGILALAVIGGVIYQFYAKSQSVSTTETAVTPSPQQSAQQTPLSKKISATPSAELEQLSQMVRDESQSQEARRKALYTLTQMGPAALPALTAIATAPMPVAISQDPHSADQMRQSFEAGLRVTAIEALDELGIDPNLSSAVKDSMLSVLKTQKHRSLTLLAQISISGIDSGRPGKVKRAIDTLKTEKE
ncbi:MAG: hypothetical protein JSU04_14845 [Bdellovibrionales bacterium]|nr:hypothetical protein [Bdellovibrionales bacterium]